MHREQFKNFNLQRYDLFKMNTGFEYITKFIIIFDEFYTNDCIEDDNIGYYRYPSLKCLIPGYNGICISYIKKIKIIKRSTEICDGCLCISTCNRFKQILTCYDERFNK